MTSGLTGSERKGELRGTVTSPGLTEPEVKEVLARDAVNMSKDDVKETPVKEEEAPVKKQKKRKRTKVKREPGTSDGTPTKHPWLLHVMAFREKHPDMKYKDVLVLAKDTYTPVVKSTAAKPADS